MRLGRPEIPEWPRAAYALALCVLYSGRRSSSTWRSKPGGESRQRIPTAQIRGTTALAGHDGSREDNPSHLEYLLAQLCASRSPPGRTASRNFPALTNALFCYHHCKIGDLGLSAA